MVDMMIAVTVLASIGLVGAATMTTRSEVRQDTSEDVAAADAVTTLRRTFGYDGVAHELDRLRRDADPAALSSLGDSLRSARGAIGTLRKEFADRDPATARALDQLESASRRLESLLRNEQGDLSARIVELPLLEPLFVLDQATDSLRDAMSGDGSDRTRHLLWLTVAAGCLLAATALLLAGWTRFSLLLPLRQLAAELSSGTRQAASRLATRQDEVGMIAGALTEPTPAVQVASADSPQLPAILQCQTELLVRIRHVVEGLAARPIYTNEPKTSTAADPGVPWITANAAEPPAVAEPEIPVFGKYPNEPETPRTPEPTPEPAPSHVLHSIVEMVAKEQVRRHQGHQASPSGPVSENDRLMSDLVDRVLIRLDQVTERVAIEKAQPSRRAS